MGEQALEGIRVLDLGNIIAGPWAGTILADFGADVIKIERPGDGDMLRGMGRYRDLWFTVDGRNKRTVTLNLKTEKGKEILTELMKKSDILIQNFRPGTFERIGFDWEKIHDINPRLIYVCVSGYGQTGPKSGKPGFDRMGLAEGGTLEVTGEAGRAPIKSGLSLGDFSTAMMACIGALMALHYRDITGEGQMIDACRTETMVRMQESIIAEYSYDGSIRTRMGNGTTITMPSGHFLTKDGKYLCISVSGDKLFNTWAEKIGREDLITDPRYCCQAQRMIPENRDALNVICAQWALEHTIDECLSVLGDDVPCAKVFNVVDIVNDPQYKYRNMILDVPTEEFGTIKMQGIVPKLSETPGKVRWPGKSLGYFNEEVYGELLNMTEEDLNILKNEGVI